MQLYILPYFHLKVLLISSVGEILDRIRGKLAFLDSRRVRQKEKSTTIQWYSLSILRYRPDRTMKLKLEVNCREHFAVFGLKLTPYAIESRWFTGQCELTTFELEELLGSKLRALYQRKKAGISLTCVRANSAIHHSLRTGTQTLSFLIKIGKAIKLSDNYLFSNSTIMLLLVALCATDE